MSSPAKFSLKSMNIFPDLVRRALNNKDLSALAGAFCWGKSREGYAYWSEIHSGRAPLDAEALRALQYYSRPPRGFAAMTPERQREIAAKGGRSVPNEKRSFCANPDLARQAGHKGGKAVPSEKRSFSQDRRLAQRAGQKGGQATADNFAAKAPSEKVES